jgi:Flp pilus assembly protein TadD
MITRQTAHRLRFAAIAASFLAAGCLPHVDAQGVASPPPEINVDGTSGETIMRLADFTRARGDIATAVALYRQAHAADPDNVLALLKLGATLSQAGNFEEAGGAFRQALELDPANATAMRGLANAYLALNRVDEAAEPLNTALTIQEIPEIRNSMGVRLDLEGKHTEAQQSYRAGLAAAPHDLDLMSNLGISLALSGNFDEAIRTLQNTASLPAATPRHRQNLALVLGLAGRDADAASLLRRDMDEATVSRAIAYYGRLRQIGDSGARAAAIGSVGGTFAGPQNASRT